MRSPDNRVHWRVYCCSTGKPSSRLEANQALKLTPIIMTLHHGHVNCCVRATLDAMSLSGRVDGHEVKTCVQIQSWSSNNTGESRDSCEIHRSMHTRHQKSREDTLSPIVPPEGRFTVAVAVVLLDDQPEGVDPDPRVSVTVALINVCVGSATVRLKLSR